MTWRSTERKGTRHTECLCWNSIYKGVQGTQDPYREWVMSLELKQIMKYIGFPTSSWREVLRWTFTLVTECSVFVIRIRDCSSRIVLHVDNQLSLLLMSQTLIYASLLSAWERGSSSSAWHYTMKLLILIGNAIVDINFFLPLVEASHCSLRSYDSSLACSSISVDLEMSNKAQSLTAVD